MAASAREGSASRSRTGGDGGHGTQPASNSDRFFLPLIVFMFVVLLPMIVVKLLADPKEKVGQQIASRVGIGPIGPSPRRTQIAFSFVLKKR